MRYKNIICSFVIMIVTVSNSLADDGYRLWMRYDRIEDTRMVEIYRKAISGVMMTGSSPTLEIMRNELKQGLYGLLGMDIPFVTETAANGTIIVGTPETSSLIKNTVTSAEIEQLGSEGFLIRSVTLNGISATLIAANTDTGLLYGAYHFLRLVQTRQRIEHIDITSKPKTNIRILNHWDGRTQRVHPWIGGRSLWNWDELPGKIDPRYIDYARANASVGINATVLNIVNADPTFLLPEYIEKLTAMADVFRPYGITLYLSVNFTSPLEPQEGGGMIQLGGVGDLDTADPLDPHVSEWWKSKTAEIYRAIPDFGGYLIKANSEGQPGPLDYGRTQAEGANLLAEAVEPHGGIVMWRAFIYDEDMDPDRVKRAYSEFMPLDGKFMKNVIVQVKNGPLDFQPREPYSPLFGAMKVTPLMLEVQLMKEYLGHATHLVYLAPMWEECLKTDTFAAGRNSTVGDVVDGTIYPNELTGIAGVANISDNRNWCGHLFDQANWYAFGRLCWDHTLSSESIADEWIRMTLSPDEHTVSIIKDLMMDSREACVNYMTPLGLHHIMQERVHYGPEPDFFRDNVRIDWTSVYYHRADETGIGFNRSSTGSNAVGQYFPPLRDMYDNIDTCPEEFLLWFHHVQWNRRMRSGRTFWNELCNRYYSGVDYVTKMRADWDSLRGNIDPEIFSHVAEKLETQECDAGIWRDTCVKYFQTFSKQPLPESVR
ncbi:alpha-glucuronidase family glycosyl hydrolase [Candidatus Latescibacterota bacterium]